MLGRGGFIRNVLAGFLIGLGAVLPGVSGGVMAVSFGLYRPMLDAVTGIFHDTRKKLMFLLPLAIGGGAGLLLGARGLGVAMAQYEKPMLFLFTGFIVGGVPDLLREAEGGGRFRRRWLLAMLAGIVLALPLALSGGAQVQADSLSNAQALCTGLMEGVGTVVPGVSTSFVLIRLGWYQAYLHAVSSMAVRELLLIALGFAASALSAMKAVKWLFDHVQGYAYYGVLGFLMVSVALVFPGFDTGALLWADIGMLVFGAVSARWLAGLGAAEKNETKE